jgi:hypothetical protein
LRYRLHLADRQSVVAVGFRPQSFRHKQVARHTGHSGKHPLVADAATFYQVDHSKAVSFVMVAIQRSSRQLL